VLVCTKNAVVVSHGSWVNGSVDWGQVGYDQQHVSLCEQPDRHAVTAQQVTREGRRRVVGRVVLHSAAGADVTPPVTR